MAEMSEGEHIASQFTVLNTEERAKLARYIDTRRINYESMSKAAEISLERAKKAEKLAEERLEAVLAQTRFACMLVEEIERLKPVASV